MLSDLRVIKVGGGEIEDRAWLARFARGKSTPLEGNEIREAYRNTGSAIGAFIDLADRAGAEIVLPVAGNAAPSGPGEIGAYEWLSGRILDAAMRAARLPRDSVFITNVVKCRPPGNRRPKPDEAAACRTYLLAQIACVRPRVIVTLGATALRGVLGPGHELRTARGEDLRLGEIPVVATYHPAGVLYNRRLERDLRRDLRHVGVHVRVVGRHLAAREQPVAQRAARGEGGENRQHGGAAQPDPRAGIH